MISFLASFILVYENLAFAQTTSPLGNFSQKEGDYLKIISNEESQKETLYLPVKSLLFDITPSYDQNGAVSSLSMSLKPELGDVYQSIGLFNKPRDIVFVYPSFTQAAYGHNGFYDYYNKRCDTSCLTVPIPARVSGFQSSSIAGAYALKLLNYPYIKDEDIDKNPDILKQYKRVIVLHSEYVTKKEFDAITSHPDVVFLYPNALYAQVNVNHTSNTITLVRGHGYPDPSVRNGFDWKSDNSKYEYNVECNDWTFYRSQENYSMLNCYPEYTLLVSPEMLTLLQIPDPTQLLTDTSNWLRYPNPSTARAMLADYDINATFIPNWVTEPANLLQNGDIHQSEFLVMLEYLYKNNIIR